MLLETVLVINVVAGVSKIIDGVVIDPLVSKKIFDRVAVRVVPLIICEPEAVFKFPTN